VEKRKSHHDLNRIKNELSNKTRLAISMAAKKGAEMIQYSLDDMFHVIKQLEQSHFYKSMTSYKKSQDWHDVYHVPVDKEQELYIKIGKSNLDTNFNEYESPEFMIISFKEK
jgi:motility quorum-sensing regulator / GCU-specific mRNA interferase toxin